MKTKRLLSYLVLSVLTIILMVGNVSAQDKEVITNNTIIKMVKAKLGEGIIISKIRDSKANFDLSTDDLIKLKDAGVSDNIINAMQRQQSPPSTSPQAKQPQETPVSPSADIPIVRDGKTISHAETKSEVWPSGRAGNIGVGVDLSAVNFGYGPLVKYWATDNIGVQATAVLGYLTGYGVRGFYEFNNNLLIAGQTMNPYAGIGYMSVSSEDSIGGIDVTYKGSAPSVFGGVEGKIPAWGPNFFWTGELVYAPMKLEGEYEYTTTDYWTGVETKRTAKATLDYSAFGVGLSLVYYFK